MQPIEFFSWSLWTAYPPDGGDYRFRVSASGFQSAGKPITYRLDAGNLSMTGKPSLVGYFDAPADMPSFVEFVAHLEPTNTMHIHPYGLSSSQTVHKVGADKYDGPGLAVEWLDVEGPLYATWPPESHKRIGAWVMDRILGSPPPKPPENIAALEPDICGATTIREQLAKHR